jgi:hypothetical protein
MEVEEVEVVAMEEVEVAMVAEEVMEAEAVAEDGEVGEVGAGELLPLQVLITAIMVEEHMM